MSKGKPQVEREAVSPLLLRAKQVSSVLGVSEREVWSMLRRGELTAIKVPGRRLTRIAMDEVEQLVARWRGQTP